MSKRKPNLRSSIYQGTDGRWHGWVTMGIKDDGSPDRRHRTGRTEAEVTAKVRALEARRDAGKIDKPGRAPTVEEWMTTYLDTIAVRTLAPRSYDDYWSKTRNWIIPHLGKHRLDRLQPEHVDKMHTAMIAAGKSSTHALKVYRVLSRALEIAVRREKVGRNVCKLVDPPSLVETEIVPLTQQEARRILATAAHRRNGARWSVGLALGLRQREALGLRWKYVDLDAGTIRVWWQVGRANWRHGCDDPHACGERFHRADARRAATGTSTGRTARLTAATSSTCARNPARGTAGSTLPTARSGAAEGSRSASPRARASAPSHCRPNSSRYSRRTARRSYRSASLLATPGTTTISCSAAPTALRSPATKTGATGKTS